VVAGVISFYVANWQSRDARAAGLPGPRLDTDSYSPAVNLRPAADWPDRAIVTVDLTRVAAVIDRIAADVDELARARRSRT
jgi:hypothetical protein